MSWLHLQDLSAGEIWDSGSIACFSSVLEPAHLHHLLRFSLLLLTWFHDLPLLGDIRDVSLHSPPCACSIFICLRGSEPHCLLLIPTSFPLLRGFVCDPGLCFAPQPFHSWACWARLLWRASSPQWVPVISAAWDACVTSLTRDRIHLPPFLSHADENPPFILLAMHPSQSPAGRSYRLPSDEGVLSIPPRASV